MSSSDDISLCRRFKTILNKTRISFDGNTTKIPLFESPGL